MSREASFLPPFIPPRQAARWATGLLLASMVAAWIAVGVDLAELRLLSQAVGGSPVEPGARAAHSLTHGWLGTLRLALLLASAVAFLIWLLLVRVNVRAMGARRLRWSRSWTIAGFLIPLVNLFRPYQVIHEVWQASDPDNLDAFNWRSVRVPRLLLVWWLLFVGCVLLQLLVLLSELGSGINLAKLQLSTLVTAAANTAAAVSAALGWFVVERISDAQQRKWEAQRQQQALPGDAA